MYVRLALQLGAQAATAIGGVLVHNSPTLGAVLLALGPVLASGVQYLGEQSQPKGS